MNAINDMKLWSFDDGETHWFAARTVEEAVELWRKWAAELTEASPEEIAGAACAEVSEEDLDRLKILDDDVTPAIPVLFRQRFHELVESGFFCELSILSVLEDQERAMTALLAICYVVLACHAYPPGVPCEQVVHRAWHESRWSFDRIGTVGEVGVLQVQPKYTRFTREQLRDRWTATVAGIEAVRYWRRHCGRRWEAAYVQGWKGCR